MANSKEKTVIFLEPIPQGRPGSQRALGPGASCAAVAVCTARCHPASRVDTQRGEREREDEYDRNISLGSARFKRNERAEGHAPKGPAITSLALRQGLTLF